jgi:hypothetical protein
VKAKAGVVVAADRPVGYMKGWPIQRVINLAARWHWRIDAFTADERAQLEAAEAAGESAA